MIDHLLGGPGAAQQPDRPLTDIEQALLRHLLSRMLRELSYALEPLGPLGPELQGLESNPGFAQAAAPTDPVVLADVTASGVDVRCSSPTTSPTARPPIAADGIRFGWNRTATSTSTSVRRSWVRSAA